MRLAKVLVTGMALLALLVWGAPPLHAQATPPAKAAQGSKQPAKAPPTAQPAAPAPAQSGPAAKAPAAKTPAAAAPKTEQAAKPAAKKSAPKKAKAAKNEQPAKVKPVKAEAPAHVARRDPFNPLVGKESTGGPSASSLPPGKAGLVVSTLKLDGLVRGPNGMIAVVSNPQQRVYFLRDGDQLYDGKVEKISMDAVQFHESGKDAFGKPVEREVTKRLYPSPGEQP